MIQITDFLPQYRELNALFANAADNSKVGYAEQQTITAFWNKHRDIKSFEKMVLDIVMGKDKSVAAMVLSSIKSEAENSIRLYESAREVFNKIDTSSVCKDEASGYDSEIETQIERANECSRELKKIDGSLEAIGFRKHTPQEKERLENQYEEWRERYEKEKAKLDKLYELQNKKQKETNTYRENLFGKLYDLSKSFLMVLNCYSESETTQSKEITTTVVEAIEPDTIFRVKMFDRLLVLEQKLIANKYLTSDLHWIGTHKNGKVDVKRLVIFLTGLVDNNYFLPNRDPKIKAFFEARYHIAIGQNFERRRRKQYLGEYKMVFYDYSF